jgi:hypothetical protein
MSEIFTIEPFPGREKCDFCSERPATQLYACRNFLIPRTKTSIFQHESVGAWAAWYARQCAIHHASMNQGSIGSRHWALHGSGEISNRTRPFALRQHDLVRIVD